jgi:very-short-patch-repair endonuclease
MTTPSAPEILVAEWLVRHKITFIPQQNMFGGTSETGGARVDFYLPALNIILRIQSYWHTIEGAEAKDVMQKAHLINDGYQVVDIWESKIKVSIDVVMKAALRGVELGE